MVQAFELVGATFGVWFFKGCGLWLFFNFYSAPAH
jgi:hypothetical protein